MGTTDDYSRRRLAAFFAARIKARHAEVMKFQRVGRDATPAPPTRTDPSPPNADAKPVPRLTDARNCEPTV